MTDLIWSPRLERNIGYVWVPIGLAGPRTPRDRGADGGAGRLAPRRSRSSIRRRTSRSHDRAHDSAKRSPPVRKPYRAASLRPAGPITTRRSIFERAGFRRDWMIVGRRGGCPSAGTYFLPRSSTLVIARGRDGRSEAFYNVCRHRGTAVVEEPCGAAGRFQCLYHAWIYDLEGQPRPSQAHRGSRRLRPAGFGSSAVRMETWQGFVFVASPNADARRLARRPPPHLARFDFGELRVAHAHLRGRYD